jgi:zinc and cadmium transporter
MPIYHSFILFAAAMAGGLIYILTGRQRGDGLKLLLAFSAAYLLGLSLLHLIPELFESGLSQPGWYILAGFMLQVILDFFSHGVEHGHAHIHPHKGMKYLFTIMAALWIHAFLEGMPFGGMSIEGAEMHDLAHSHHHHHHSHDHRGSLLLGISLHKITEALVFTALLIASGLTKSRAIFWLTVFALMAPAGAWLHYGLIQSGAAWVASLGGIIIGVLVGILLHVSTTILFESESGHKFNLMKFVIILAGIALAAFVS